MDDTELCLAFFICFCHKHFHYSVRNPYCPQSWDNLNIKQSAYMENIWQCYMDSLFQFGFPVIMSFNSCDFQINESFGYFIKLQQDLKISERMSFVITKYTDYSLYFFFPLIHMPEITVTLHGSAPKANKCFPKTSLKTVLLFFRSCICRLSNNF